MAPEGSVAKITGKEGLQFRGPARVFDSEEDMLAVVAEDPQQLKVKKLITCLCQYVVLSTRIFDSEEGHAFGRGGTPPAAQGNGFYRTPLYTLLVKLCLRC